MVMIQKSNLKTCLRFRALSFLLKSMIENHAEASCSKYSIPFNCLLQTRIRRRVVDVRFVALGCIIGVCL